MDDNELKELIMERVRQLSEKEQQIVLDYIRFLKKQQDEEKKPPLKASAENNGVKNVHFKQKSN